MLPVAVSLATVKREIEEARKYGEVYGWEISAIDEPNQRFTVLLQSPIDQLKYLIEFGFDDFPEKPYVIEFLDLQTEAKNIRASMPKCEDSFFNESQLTICHPCSRNAYQRLHREWAYPNWRELAKGMDRLVAILDAIFTRISNSGYHGRMV